MAAKYLVFIAACFMLALQQASGLQAINGRIKITIGTTAGCSDTVNFIGNQLSEAYRLYGDYLDIEFVPWGRTTWSSDDGIVCQFGNNDCWANRLHRCVLNELRDNQAAQIHYMQCEFATPYPAFLQTSYLCAQAVGLNLVDIDYCVTNNGDELDRTAQVAATVPIASINFVPYIMFNDVIDRDIHDQARVRLSSMICFALAEDPTTGITSCQI